MKTRKLSLLSIAMLMVLMLGSCAQKSKLQRAVEDFNSRCPMTMNAASRIEKVVYEDDVVKMTMMMDEQLVNLDQLSENQDILKDNLLAIYSGGQGELNTFLKLLTDAGADLEAIYMNTAGEEKIRITLTCEELKKALESEGESPEKMLDRLVNTTNLSLPIQLADGMTLTAMVKEEGQVAYTYDVSDEIFQRVAANFDAAEQETRGNLMSMSATDKKSMLPVCDAGMALCYRYKNVTTGDSLQFVIKNYELNYILRNNK